MFTRQPVHQPPPLTPNTPGRYPAGSVAPAATAAVSTAAQADPFASPAPPGASIGMRTVTDMPTDAIDAGAGVGGDTVSAIAGTGTAAGAAAATAADVLGASGAVRVQSTVTGQRTPWRHVVLIVDADAAAGLAPFPKLGLRR